VKPKAFLIVVGSAIGCSASPGTNAPDARVVAVIPCTANDLTLGRCVTDASEPCAGLPNEVRRFEAMAPQEELSAILGPQGSNMFVLAARTTGIVPGDPIDPTHADNPLLEIVVVDDASSEIARYLGRAGFVDEGTALTLAGLFVVVSDTVPVGRTLTAHGALTDAMGVERCGSLPFIAR